MPFLFRRLRRETMATQRVRQYAWYAIGEVLLIFIGITLALTFDDWSEQRRQHRQEIASLEDIASNLRANIERLSSTIQSDGERQVDCRGAIQAIEEGAAWEPGFGELFDACRYWSSPYLHTAAYESLKAGGTDLISNPVVRAGIVNLFEGSYAYLIGDVDREQWDFQSAVVLPVWNRFLRTKDGNRPEPSNYRVLLQSEEFLNALYNRRELLDRSILIQGESSDDTRTALAFIEQELARLQSQ